MDPNQAQQYYECMCQWLRSHEGAMHSLLGQLRGANNALCTQTECFESGAAWRHTDAPARARARKHPLTARARARAGDGVVLDQPSQQCVLDSVHARTQHRRSRDCRLPR